MSARVLGTFVSALAVCAALSALAPRAAAAGSGVLPAASAAAADTLDVVRWEDAVWNNFGGLVDPDVWPTRALTGLFLSMYMAGSQVDDRFDLDVDLPAATASADEAAAAAGRAYLRKFLDADAGDLAPAGSDADPALDALADAAADAAWEIATRTTGDPVPYRPFAVAGRYVPPSFPAIP